MRHQAGQKQPAFSTQAIIDKCLPRTLVTGRTLPAGILEAVARTERGPVILYARGLPVGRQRLAISHAIAHLIFDGDGAFRRPGQDCIEYIERRADAFAEELLVPLDELEKYVRCWPSRKRAEREVYLDMVDEIASRFKVTSEVVGRRIRKLRRLVKNRVRK